MTVTETLKHTGIMIPNSIDDLLKEVADDLQQYIDDVADALENPPTDEEIRRKQEQWNREFEEMESKIYKDYAKS